MTDTSVPSGLVPVFIDTVPDAAGALAPETARLLTSSGAAASGTEGLILPAPQAGLEEAFSNAHRVLSGCGLVGPLRGEMMSVLAGPDRLAVATVDRSLLRIFGFPGIKVHINGLVPMASGIRIWLARRAENRRAAPLHLDTMVAGGQPYDKTALETAIMEAGEEAGLQPQQLGLMREANVIDVNYNSPEGYHRERLVIYDLDLPETFTPVLCDDELTESLAVTPAELRRLLDGGDIFKFNSAIVCRDLLERLAL